MPKVAVIYTVPSVYASFPDLIRENIPGAEITNTLDEFLAYDPHVKGEFTKNNLNRLHALLRCAEMTDPDAIVVTCSTLTPPVETLRPLISKPLIAIDGLMLKKAVAAGSAITIFASARSTIEPARIGLTREAGLLGKTLDLETKVNDEAYTAIKKMDKATHDRLILEQAKEIRNRDVIILAQASMGHLEEEVQRVTGIRTLSSPKLCMEELKMTLGV